MASHNLHLWLQSCSFLSLPIPWHKQGTCLVLVPLLAIMTESFSSCCCVWLYYCFLHGHVTSAYIFHWAEAHLPSTSVRAKYHFSRTLHSAWLSGWMRTWSWITWQHISLYMSILLLDSFLPAPADPNSILLCRDCTCTSFQVSYPTRELHGRRKNPVNCSCCLILSMLKQRRYIRCWVFFWISEYSGTKLTQILTVHQISMRFFNV